MAINKVVKVLIVEDSRFFRELLANAINKDPGLEVVATAGEPFEARDAILKYRPDVMTLDVEMPGMSGIEFIRRLLPQYPIPVVMVSSLNAAVFDALEAGAVDFVNKPIATSPQDVERFVQHELITKLKIASVAKLGSHKAVPHRPSAMGSMKGFGDRILAIGASTGGTEAIFNVVKKFDIDIPGVVVTQHMPPGFTAMYADRLNNQCKVRVKEAKNGDDVVQGQVLIAPGDMQMRLIKSPLGTGYKVECKPGEKVSGHCPSVDVLFDSVAKAAGKKAIGVLLTGMGADGAKGLLAMKNSGAETIGQDEASCVVYGMPKVAYEIGAVKYQMSLEQITGKIYSILKSGR